MTIRARKHAVMTDIEKFEKRDRRTHRSIGISPYHTSRRAKNRRERKSEGWVYTWDGYYWYIENMKTHGYVARRLWDEGYNAMRYVFAEESATLVTKKCETLAEAKRFAEGQDEVCI